MSNKKQIIELSLDINFLLSQYINIHDDVFKPSIRRLIPIPGIFKSIDFDANLKKIENINIRLEYCCNKIYFLTDDANKKEQEYLELLSNYVNVLIKTISYLKIIVEELCSKSQGSSNSNYKLNDYNNDIAKYNQLVQDYTKIGKYLNASFEKIQQ